MIIKSKSYKNNRSFTTVLGYIFRENEKGQSFMLTKFIKGKDLSTQELHQQFLTNEANLLKLCNIHIKWSREG